MEPYEILGVVFRSHGHAVWFGIGLFSIFAHIVNRLFVRIIKPAHTVRYGMTPFLIYTGAMASAIVATRGGVRESGPYTADCIWFNALMVLAHVLIMIRLPYKVAALDRKQRF